MKARAASRAASYDSVASSPERVDRAVDVGVAALVVALHRLEDLARLLARGRRVEVDERLAVDHARARMGKSGRVLSPSVTAPPPGPRAPPGAPTSGSVTHLIRVGRMSASSRSRSADGSTAGRRLHRASDRHLEQQVGRRGADGAAVAPVARIREASVGDPALDTDPVAAERVDVLEGEVRAWAAHPETGAA